MPGRTFAGVAALSTLISLAACGETMSKDKREGALAAYAQTALGEGKPGANKMTAEQKAEQEAKVAALIAKRKAEKKAKLDAQLAGLAVLPDPLPKGMTKACDAVVDAYHEFQLKVHAGDDTAILDWYKRKKNTLGKRRNRCMQLGSVEAAACQANALAKAPGTLAEHEQALLRTCVEKFAPDAVAKLGAQAPGKG